jgi:hypothetical protein
MHDLVRGARRRAVNYPTQSKGRRCGSWNWLKTVKLILLRFTTSYLYCLIKQAIVRSRWRCGGILTVRPEIIKGRASQAEKARV